MHWLVTDAVREPLLLLTCTFPFGRPLSPQCSLGASWSGVWTYTSWVCAPMQRWPMSYAYLDYEYKYCITCWHLPGS